MKNLRLLCMCNVYAPGYILLTDCTLVNVATCKLSLQVKYLQQSMHPNKGQPTLFMPYFKLSHIDKYSQVLDLSTLCSSLIFARCH